MSGRAILISSDFSSDEIVLDWKTSAEFLKIIMKNLDELVGLDRIKKINKSADYKAKYFQFIYRAKEMYADVKRGMIKNQQEVICAGKNPRKAIVEETYNIKDY